MTNAKEGIGEGSLTYRLATDDDLELCKRYRIECGWGEERLAANWGNPDKPICVFSVGNRDVGMGGWYLELPDPEDASRKLGAVQLSSLFISQDQQGLGLGGRALDLLEKAALELFGAKTVTLDTRAHANAWEKGASGERIYVEDPSAPSMPKQWYMRRGYEVYKPNAPLYPIPYQPDKSIMGCFLRKNMR